MITATYMPFDGYTKVCLNLPNKLEYINVEGGLGEAQRLVYYHNRKYIHTKMYSWLNQRKIAIKQSDDKTKVLTVATLQVMFSSHENASLYQLCKMVKEHTPFIEKVAPVQGSTYFNYYEKVIKPIIQYCSAIE